MRRKLLSTIGYDADSHLVHIGDARKGETYTCPQCGERIVVRNSGKTAKGSKRPHFAHIKKSRLKCSGESVLIHLFKKQAIHLLQQCLDANLPFPIEWTCNYCNQKYTKNLLQQTTGITTGLAVGNTIPDITLTDKDGQPIIVIELTTRPKLNRKVVQQYEESGLVLIQIRLSEKDALMVEDKLHHPDHVGFCSNKECYNNQFYQRTIRREIFHQPLKCKTCNKVVDGYMVKENSAFGTLGRENLTSSEKEEIIRLYFQGKKATVASFAIYGPCKCKPYSKNLQSVKKRG